MLVLALVLGAVVAGAVPPAPATAGPPGCPVFPFPETGIDGLNRSPGFDTLPSTPPPSWSDRLAGLVYRGVLKPVLKLLRLL